MGCKQLALSTARLHEYAILREIKMSISASRAPFDAKSQKKPYWS
jgi:hypothetical protein